MTQGIHAFYIDGYRQRRRIASFKDDEWWPIKPSQADVVLLSGESRRVSKLTVELQIGNITAPLYECVKAGITMEMLK
jgi:hypothetical protein